MPETSVTVTDAATGAEVDGYSLPDGKVQQAVVIGDGTTQGRIVGVTSDGRLQVKMDVSATATITSVAITTTGAAANLIAADATGGRIQLILFNDTLQTAYVRLDATAATSTNNSFEMPPGSYWESPRNFVGAASVLWASTAGSGTMHVTAI